MIQKTQRSAFVELFVPRYDELSLFLMSTSFLLVFFLDPELQDIARKFLVTEFDPKLFPFYALFVLFLSGVAFSLFHAFTNIRKTDAEKTAMLYFAVMVNGLSGFLAGAHLFQTAHGYIMVFPIWNVLNSLLLLLMYWVQLIDESAITDDNAAPREIVVSGTVVFAVFLLCQFLFRLHWTMTFSVCVCYATNVNAFLRRLFPTPHQDPISPEITFTCPECGRTITFDREREGLADLCPKCGEVITVGRVKRR